jgi:hypothetical protein
MAKKPSKREIYITGKKFRKALYDFLPIADIQHDNDGQVIIYTGLTEINGDNYTKID